MVCRAMAWSDSPAAEMLAVSPVAVCMGWVLLVAPTYLVVTWQSLLLSNTLLFQERLHKERKYRQQEMENIVS